MIQAKQWAYSRDEHRYTGYYATPEEAASECLDGDEDGTVCYVGECEDPIQPERVFDANEFLEQVSCQDDYQGEHAEDWDGSTKEQRDILTQRVSKVIADWLDEFCLRPKHFLIGEVKRFEVVGGEVKEIAKAKGGAR
jgi:hypothetical protein